MNFLGSFFRASRRDTDGMGVTPQEAIEKAIDSSDEISQVTKNNYKIQFGNLVRLAGGSATTVFRNPDKVYDAMLEKYPSALTRRALLTVARCIIKLLPAVNAKFPSARDQYAEFQKKDAGIARESDRLMDGKLSDRERETFVPWDEIVATREWVGKEDPTSERYLLLAMYTFVEPVRQDYGNVKILYAEPMPSEAESVPNYIVLDRSDKKVATLAISEYKTAKIYGVHKRHLPKELVAVIWKTLDARPREFLFVDSRDLPFEKRNSFSKWTNRTLAQIFGKRVTINTFRHSFISNLDFNSRTPGEIMRSAKMMGHSIGQQQLYRRLPSPERAAPKRETSAPAPVARAPMAEQNKRLHAPAAAPQSRLAGGIVVVRPTDQPAGLARAEPVPRPPPSGRSFVVNF
jgi:hypothetical protein